MSTPSDDVLPKTTIWPDRPDGPVHERAEMIPGARERVYRVATYGFGETKRPYVFDIEVISRTAKQVRVVGGKGTDFRTRFETEDFTKKFFASPELAIEAWKADLARQVVDLEEQIGVLNHLAQQEPTAADSNT